MKRIHFTAEDLMRTRVAPTIGVAAETFDSVRMLREHGGGLAFRRWQVAVRGRLREQALPLVALMPRQGPLVDVVSLAGSSASIDEAVDQLLRAPRDLMRIELENVDFRPTYRSLARNLVDGDRTARLQVASALRACHGLTVAPYWTRVRTHLTRARAAYVDSLAEGGVEQLLTSLCGPLVRWRPPVLEIRHPRDQDVHLNGRGLVIAPTLFSSQEIELLQAPLDPDRPPVLAIPSVRDALDGTALWDGTGEFGAEPLDDLLGRTRAAVLRAAVDGCGTTDLARVLEISPATTSHHTSVLRKAGLIASRRDGRTVVHTVTPLGRALLEPGSGTT
ncbi:helix-turn-helix domain-containing protein [Streptomyces sp. NPDC007084]|uniref:ArsR/SmtB family transcription factor n=1 Tax=Streptomyces sp. NPDC007084 TaxID=3154313 RepID=UPI003453423B